MKYTTRDEAIRAALDLKKNGGPDFWIMQAVGTTAPPPVNVELSKEEYSATSEEVRERTPKEGEEKEISSPEATTGKG